MRAEFGGVGGAEQGGGDGGACRKGMDSVSTRRKGDGAHAVACGTGPVQYSVAAPSSNGGIGMASSTPAAVLLGEFSCPSTRVAQLVTLVRQRAAGTLHDVGT